MMSSLSQHQRRPILGEDGSCHLEKDAMGVPGFHVLVNAFTPATHRKVFENKAAFETNSMPFVQQQQFPIQQTIFHPTLDNGTVSGPWPDDFHRLINAVRDSQLFPQATIPDCAYGLTYHPDSHFPAHHDSRHKWGEYVICVSLGAPCTITFQHAAPKKNPFDPSRPSSWVPPDPHVDSYYTKSLTDEVVSPYNRRLWQVTMTLPPNSMYVMSGSSRFDWKHGINCNPNHHPTPSQNEMPWLYPAWNTLKYRRSVIYRATKIFSNVSLETELEIARKSINTVNGNAVNADLEAVASIEKRIKISNKYKPMTCDLFTGQQVNFTPEGLNAETNRAHDLLQYFSSNQSDHRILRFNSNEVLFSNRGRTRATQTQTHQHNRDGCVDTANTCLRREKIASVDDANTTIDTYKPKDNEIIVIDDSSEDEEDRGDDATNENADNEYGSTSTCSHRGTKRASVDDVSDVPVEDKQCRMRAARLQRFCNASNNNE
jgi:alkylated DNA repair dioxygenase AlkB